MKYLKFALGTGFAALAFMALVGSASATVVTSPSGTTLKGGAKIEAELTPGTEAVFKSSFIGEIKCKAPAAEA